MADSRIPGTGWLGPRSRQDPLILLALVVAAGCAWLLYDRLAYVPGIAFWIPVCAIAAVGIRSGFVRLVGPLVPHELVTTARRSRFVLFRLYVYFILFLFAVVYVVWSNSDRSIAMAANKAADTAEGFFYLFTAGQMVFVLLIVPAYMGGAIAEEKERRSLEGLLTTDLENREIVLSKLLVRGANVALTLLTGFPIVAVLLLLGGIEPDLALAAFLATLLTALSVGALAVLNSTYARRSRDAILHTYLQVVAVMVIGSSLNYFPLLPLPLGEPWIHLWSWLGQALDWLALLSPITFFVRIGGTLLRGVGLRHVLPGMLAEYLSCHVVFIVLLTSWSSLRLRAVFRRQAYGEAREAGARFRWRPALRGWPMFWKEVLVEPSLRVRWFGRIVLLALLLVSFAPPVYLRFLWHGARPDDYARAVSVWMRASSTCVACLLLLGVAVRAATAISGERDRDAWDSLLTTPLDTRSLLGVKWLASVSSVRWGWAWIALIWVYGMTQTDINPLGPPCFALAWLVYASVMAIAGLWYSLVCESGMRALICTLFTAGFLGLGFLILPLYSHPYVHKIDMNDPLGEWFTRFQFGLAPPMVLARLLPFWPDDRLWGVGQYSEHWERGFAWLGLSCWLLTGFVWGSMLWRKFRRLTGREALRRPEVAAPHGEVLVLPAEC